MDKWIRSQNQERLINAKDIEIIYCYNGSIKEEDITYDIFVNGICTVGKYKTKEEALDVLNRIQRDICTENNNSNNFTIPIIATYIYDLSVILLFITLALLFQKWWLSILAIFFFKDTVRYKDNTKNKEESVMDLDDEELEATRKLNGADKEENVDKKE